MADCGLRIGEEEEIGDWRLEIGEEEEIGDWRLEIGEEEEIGDWRLEIGMGQTSKVSETFEVFSVSALFVFGVITNHQSPITNHQSPITNHQSLLLLQSPISNL